MMHVVFLFHNVNYYYHTLYAYVGRKESAPLFVPSRIWYLTHLLYCTGAMGSMNSIVVCYRNYY